jgi:hypothetical protein
MGGDLEREQNRQITTVTTTTTYGWQNTIKPANTTGYVECRSDAGVNGDSVDPLRLYASTDKFSAVSDGHAARRRP